MKGFDTWYARYHDYYDSIEDARADYPNYVDAAQEYSAIFAKFPDSQEIVS